MIINKPLACTEAVEVRGNTLCCFDSLDRDPAVREDFTTFSPDLPLFAMIVTEKRSRG